MNTLELSDKDAGLDLLEQVLKDEFAGVPQPVCIAGPRRASGPFIRHFEVTFQTYGKELTKETVQEGIRIFKEKFLETDPAAVYESLCPPHIVHRYVILPMPVRLTLTYDLEFLTKVYRADILIHDRLVK